MVRCRSLLRAEGHGQFNMTAMIDVVFLLIIFFMLICQFIVRENYDLVVPDDCSGAVVPDSVDRNAVTVSVFRSGSDEAGGSARSRKNEDESGVTGRRLRGGSEEGVVYAVRSRRYDPRESAYEGSAELLWTAMVDDITEQTARKADALVHLRADRELRYGEVQEALLAVSRAGVRQVQLAAFRSVQEDEPMGADDGGNGGGQGQ